MTPLGPCVLFLLLPTLSTGSLTLPSRLDLRGDVSALSFGVRVVQGGGCQLDVLARDREHIATASTPRYAVAGDADLVGDAGSGQVRRS